MDKECSKRQLKFASELKHEISKIIVEGGSSSDFVISVSDVSVSPDLRAATVFICCYSEVYSDEYILSELKEFFRQVGYRKVADSFSGVKYLPRIVFKIDRQNKEAAKIDKLIDQL